VPISEIGATSSAAWLLPTAAWLPPSWYEMVA
jgi:hypothetical protein